MKTNTQLPLNWALVEPLLRSYCDEKQYVFGSAEIFGNKIAVKILRPGVPIRLDLFETRRGLTVQWQVGKDYEANHRVLDYIDEKIGFSRLHEDRISFRNVTELQLELIKKRLNRLISENHLTTEWMDDTLRIHDVTINNAVKVEFYRNGTVYLYGFTTSVFDEIYNIIHRSVNAPTEEHHALMDSILSTASSHLQSSDRHECTACGHFEKCQSNGNSMLHAHHFERTIATYPCTRVTGTYVCKYYPRYVSELINVFSYLKWKSENDVPYSVLSIGSGPSPELVAIKTLNPDLTVHYTGIDYNPHWGPIQSFFKENEQANSTIKYYRYDLFGTAHKLNSTGNVLPFSLVLINYVVSSMHVSHSDLEILDLLAVMENQIFRHLSHSASVVFNDINNGEHFVEIMEKIITDQRFGEYVFDRYFHAGNNRRYLSSGTAITSTKLRFGINPDHLDRYNAPTECNSAAYIMRRKA